MADPRERFNDHQEALQVAFTRKLGTVWTMLPVQIEEDSEGHICTAKSTIKGIGQGDKGEKQTPEMTSLGSTIPVCYTQGGGFVITHPVKKGDEGIVVFASRSLDGWHQKGSVQEQAIQRRHDLSDGIYIPGVRSDPRKLGGNGNGGSNGQAREGNGAGNGQKKSKPPSTNSVQIRTESGDYYIELTDKDVNIVCVNCTIKAEELVEITCKNMKVTAEQEVRVKAQKVFIDAPRVEMTGDLEVRGSIVAKGEVTGRNIRLSSHVHTRVQGGMGVSGPPRSG